MSFKKVLLSTVFGLSLFAPQFDACAMEAETASEEPSSEKRSCSPSINSEDNHINEEANYQPAQGLPSTQGLRLDNLPDDVLVTIFSHDNLTLLSLQNLRLICQAFNRVITMENTIIDPDNTEQRISIMEYRTKQQDQKAETLLNRFKKMAQENYLNPLQILSVNISSYLIPTLREAIETGSQKPAHYFAEIAHGVIENLQKTLSAKQEIDALWVLLVYGLIWEGSTEENNILEKVTTEKKLIMQVVNKQLATKFSEVKTLANEILSWSECARLYHLYSVFNGLYGYEKNMAEFHALLKKYEQEGSLIPAAIRYMGTKHGTWGFLQDLTDTSPEPDGVRWYNRMMENIIPCTPAIEDFSSRPLPPLSGLVDLPNPAIAQAAPANEMTKAAAADALHNLGDLEETLPGEATDTTD